MTYDFRGHFAEYVTVCISSRCLQRLVHYLLHGQVLHDSAQCCPHGQLHRLSPSRISAGNEFGIRSGKVQHHTSCVRPGFELHHQVGHFRKRYTRCSSHFAICNLCSDYTGNSSCSEQELVSYTAYTTDTCYGYVNGNSSTLFTANVSASKLAPKPRYKHGHNS